MQTSTRQISGNPVVILNAVRFVGVSPQQSYKKQTSFGGLIPTYFAGTSSGLQAVGLVILNAVKDIFLNK
jgi:hypothetical protein